MKYQRHISGIAVLVLLLMSSIQVMAADLDCSDLAGVLSCGMMLSGDTGTRGQLNVSAYSCTARDLSGKELVYQFNNIETQDIVIRLSGMTVDLDVMILSACDEGMCLAWGDEEFCYEQLPPGTYYIVVDGYAGAEGTYVIEIACGHNEGMNRWSDCENPLPPTSLGTTAAYEWHFYNGKTCRLPGDECTYSMYVSGECGDSVYIPLYDVESAGISVYDYGAQAYLDVYAESTSGWTQGPQTFINWEDCTGLDPRWNLQTTTVSFNGTPAVCGVYRIDFIDMGGEDYYVYANCDGSSDPGYIIYDNFCDAWSAYTALPELSITNVVLTDNCPEYELTFDVVNTGCVSVDVPVHAYSSLGGSNDMTVLNVGPGMSKTGSMPLTVSGYGSGTISVAVDYYDTVVECSETGGSDVPCYPEGDYGEEVSEDINCICEIPVASFTSNSPQCDEDPICFTDTSTGDPDSWFWSFGDGGVSFDQHPCYLYSAGEYTVTFVATNKCGSSTPYVDTVKILIIPEVNFDYTKPVCTGNPVCFTDLSVNDPDAWHWDFGDGNTSDLQNPCHIYTDPGDYVVVLTASNMCGAHFHQKIITVLETPVANFSHDAPKCVGDPVQFNDLSAGSPNAWLWDFGDSTTSALQNPTHAYVATGTYTVTLIVSNDDCGDSETYSDTVEIIPPPTAGFTHDAPKCAGQSVCFTDTSVDNPTSWLWDFGDGHTSGLQNPCHMYDTDGDYTVTLIVSNNCGDSAPVTDVVTITPGPIASFDRDNPKCGNTTICFTDTSAGATSWTWDFGDGGTSADQNPCHSYAGSGPYTVSLIVSDGTCVSDPATEILTLNVDERVYYPGDLIMVMDHAPVSTDQEIYDAYGLTLKLANRGIVVDWIINQNKVYEGKDFTAVTDDNPNPVTSGVEGVEASRDYHAGPFIVRDPDRSTVGWEYNDAWDDIVEIQTEFGYDVNFDEVREPFSIQECSHVFYVTYMPRICIGDDLAIDELDLSQIPYDFIESPGLSTDPITIAGGGLFDPVIDPICGKIRKYEMYCQGHYDWYGPLGEGDPTVDPNELAAISEIDDFIKKAGFCVFECISASIEQTAHWLTEDGSAVHEGVPGDANFTINTNWEKHPFLQTMGSIPIQGGAFQVWNDLTNTFRSNVQNILYDAATDDIGYVFGAVGSGKTYYMGGHQRKVVSDHRLVLNSYIYDVVFPKFYRSFAPDTFATGMDQYLTVYIYVTGGCDSIENHIKDTFAPDVEYVDGSLNILVPSSTFDGYDDITHELTMTIDDFNPIDYEDGIIASYQVKINTISEGPFKVLDHANSYTDPWNADYYFETSGCADVTSAPILSVTKTASPETIPVGSPVTVTLTVSVSNNNTQGGLTNVSVTDDLPGGITYVPGTITVTKGSAPDAMPLNWAVGDLGPSETALCTFDVLVTASAPGMVTLNIAAAADGEYLGSPVTDTSDAVQVEAAAGVPILQSVVTPLNVGVNSWNTHQLCVKNIGAAGTFIKIYDYIEVLIPDGWTLDTGSIVLPLVPANRWEYDYNAASRRLTFTYPPGNFNWNNGMAICFSYDLLSPDAPGTSLKRVISTLNDRADVFVQNILMNTQLVCGVSIISDATGDAVAGETICYPHIITNTGNGTDIMNLVYTNTFGWTVNFYEDIDASGTYTPVDVPLVDTDGDTNIDSGHLQGGLSMDILACVEVPDTATIGQEDTMTITVISSCDTSLTDDVIDTTTVVPVPTATPTPILPTGTPTITAIPTFTYIPTLTPTPAPIPYFNNFERGTSYWLENGLWHVVNDATHDCFETPVPESSSHSAVTSWYYGKDDTCNYNTGISNTGSLVSPPIAVTENAVLSFWSWEQTDGIPATDYRRVYITTNYGTDWKLVYDSSNNDAAWYQKDIDLAAYSGEIIQIKFEFDSVNALLNDFRGWYMDDMEINPYTATPTITPSPTYYDSPTPTATPGCDDIFPLPYHADFENRTECWINSGLWHLVNDTGHPCYSDPLHPDGSLSPEHAWYYGRDTSCDYDTGARTTGELVSPGILISGDVVASVGSWESTENFSGYDLREVHISDNDGVDWTLIASSSNNSADWYEWQIPVSGYDGKTVKFKFVFDSVDETANQFPGWYLDDFSVMQTTPTPTAAPTVVPTVTPFCYHTYFLDTDPGWTMQNQWEFGKPQGLGGPLPDAYPDPKNGCTGDNVYGYNLAGNYPAGLAQTYYLTSGSIDCSYILNTRLQFCRWLGVGAASDNHHASVEVSNNGSTWNTVWENTGTKPINDGIWKTVTYDISDIADGQPRVFIRWGMGPAGSGQTYCGWNIDDIQICGVSSGPTATPTGTPTGTWYTATPTYTPTATVTPTKPPLVIPVVQPFTKEFIFLISLLSMVVLVSMYLKLK